MELTDAVYAQITYEMIQIEVVYPHTVHAVGFSQSLKSKGLSLAGSHTGILFIRFEY